MEGPALKYFYMIHRDWEGTGTRVPGLGQITHTHTHTYTHTYTITHTHAHSHTHTHTHTQEGAKITYQLKKYDTDADTDNTDTEKDTNTEKQRERKGTRHFDTTQRISSPKFSSVQFNSQLFLSPIGVHFPFFGFFLVVKTGFYYMDGQRMPLSIRHKYKVRFGFFRRILQSEKLSHPTLKTHCRMNEISRKFPEFAKSVKKGLKSQTLRK